MRTLSGGESTVLSSAAYQVGWRVKVENGSGTMINYSSLSSRNYIAGFKLDEEVDQPVGQATVEFARSASSTLSLAPLREDSTLNRLDNGTTYSPALDPGRRITVEAYTIAIGASPSAGDYKLVFDGYIDSVDAATEKVVCVCRDEGGLLVDTWIEAPGVYAGGDAMEDYIQIILDAWMEVPMTLFCPVPTLFEMKPITEAPEPSSVMGYLLQITGLIGWDIRYKWDSGTNAFRLTLYEPNRTNATADYTFAKSRYINVSKCALDRTNIRNAIVVEYGPARPRSVWTSEDATSGARYGRRWLKLIEATDSQIDTEAEAIALADAILADLKDPVAEFLIERPFWWPGQVGDIYAFTEDDIRFDTEQKFAVVGIRHEVSVGSHRTSLVTRGRAAGGLRRWTSPRGGPFHGDLFPTPPPAGGPTIDAGCICWLKTETLLAALSAGDGIAFWPDSSGHANHATQATGTNQFVLELDALDPYGPDISRYGQLDSYPAALGDNSDDGMSTPCARGAGEAMSLYFIYAANANGVASYHKVLQGVDNFTQSLSFGWSTYHQAIGQWPPSGSINDTAPVVDGEFNIFSYTRPVSDAGTAYFYKNGALVGTLTGNLTCFGTMQIGSTGGFPPHALLPEVIVYDREHSTAARKRTELYLGGKYGISIAP